MKISKKKMSYEEWKEQRRKGIGGSDAAAIIGLNKWKSPIRVYLEKIGEFQNEESNEAMYWGSKMEDLIAKEYSDRSGNYVERRNYILIHPDHDWMIANVDRIIYAKDRSPGVLECKNVSEFRKEEWKDDEVPPEAYCQLQHYLAVTGFVWGVIAALIGGNKFIYKHFDRDEEFISSLISLESEFWKRIEERNPPPADGSDDSSEVLNILYPQAVPESSINLPYETADTIQRLIQLKQSIKELEDEKAEKENRLKELLGENETGYVEKWRVDWKSYTSTRLDTKALKNSQPNIYQEFSRETESRRFSIREV